MANLTIRNIDETLKAALRQRAARNNHSMEEEVRQLLHQAVLRDKTHTGLGSRIAQRFAHLDGIELPAIKRSVPRTAPDWDERNG